MKRFIIIGLCILLFMPLVFADIRNSLQTGWNLVSHRSDITDADLASSTIASVWGITTDSAGVKRWCLIKGTSTAVSACPSTFSVDNRAWVDKK